MDKEQEYYYNGEYVVFYADVVDHPEFAIVQERGGDGEFTVVRKDSLVKKEDSYEWKQQQAKADELRKITAKAQENFDDLVEKLIKKATETLSSRMKFNAIFGNKAGNLAGWAVDIANELEKLVKEKAKDVVKDDKDPF